MRRFHWSNPLFVCLLVAPLWHCTTGAPAKAGIEGGSTASDAGTSGQTEHMDAGNAVDATDAGSVDAAVGCFPDRTCESVGAQCGQIGDGCGGVIRCGPCPSGQVCGGGGAPNVCGTGTCNPRTCAAAGANCGLVSDGCGGLLQCGACNGLAMCGGGGVPNVCPGTQVQPCDGLCQQQVTCPGSASGTTISGIVHAPTPPSYGAADPLYDVLVFVPNGPVDPFTKGVSCGRCNAITTGNPLITTVTGADGRFVLHNAPAGKDIPLVIQLGRWRRQITIPNVYPCMDNKLPDELTRLPRDHTEGDIPQIAMVTGSADAMECMLRKIGISDIEFTPPSGGGRVHMYKGNGSDIAGGAPDMSTLVNDPATLNQYDMVLFGCEGKEFQQSSTAQTNLINYTNAGGRIFASHFGYVWFFNDAPFSNMAAWNVAQPTPLQDPMTATVDQSFDRGAAFAQWLKNVGASRTLGTIAIQEPRHDFDKVLPPAQRWLYSSSQPLHFTFDTPVGATPDMQCGRALYSDFHIAGGGVGSNGGHQAGPPFPGECTTTPLSAQEKALEFMMFDLAGCVAPGGGVILK